MSVSLGNELKDSFKETGNWVNNNLVFLSDVEQFYRQRSQIEKEYASQLAKLSTEFLKKKSMKSTNVSVGDDPKFTPGSLESASLVAWTELLSETETIAKNHNNFGNELAIKCADQVLALQRTCEGLKNRVDSIYSDTLVKHKNEIFDHVTKAKKRYDDMCSSMESTRSKAEKSGNKDKYQSKLHDKETEMNVSKNEYLIKINIANRVKDKFYYQDLPELLDVLQDLSEFKTRQLDLLWKNGCTLETNKNTKDNKSLERICSVVNENQPQLDTTMFIKHNQSSWTEPQDFYYIPSSIWHDDELFITKPEELQYLKKSLVLAYKNSSKYDEALESERENLNKLQTKRQSLKTSESFEFKDSIDSLQSYLNILNKFVIDETYKVSAQVEIETIENNAGEQDLSLDNLTITTKKRGLLSRFKHGGSSKKEVVQDINVFGDGESIKSSKSHHSQFKLGSILRPRTTSIISSVSAVSSSSPSKNSGGIALYDYQSSGEDEVSILAQEAFNIVSEDDGSGWTMISKTDGQQGLVPTSYIQISTAKAPATPAPRKRNTKKVNYCVAKFDYEAEDEGELSVQAGDRIEVVTGDDGGWTEGEINGKRGVFPTSYVDFE